MFDRGSKSGEFRRGVKQLARGDPFALAQALRVPPPSPRRREISSKTGRPESFQSENGTDWSGVLNAWLDACEAADAGRAVESYDKQATLHATFNQVFASSAGNLLVPALLSICKSTHRLAVAADQETGSRDNAKLQNAVTLLQESFSRTFNDRKELKPNAPYDEEGSKKVAVLGIVNELFNIYFQLNTLRLCKNLVKPVESRKLQLQGSMGQMVTYRYYTGRLNLFEDNWTDAEQNLEYALTRCHKNAVHNKRCILRYLVPVKLYLGKLPTKELLEKYQLHEFTAVVEGIRKGDLKTFNAALVEFQHIFIRQGTYLLLERCRTVCYRSLFKRIYIILQKHQISLDLVVTAFKWLDIPIDLDEVECILANLIYRSIIRGYISHSKRVLVLSKRDPFPALAAVGGK